MPRSAVMGNCVGGGNEENTFKVTNIKDNSSGELKLTAIDLSYVDDKTKEDWHWPLKYVRKYGCGCGGNIFIIEAGRKCPGGEGMYAFQTKKASVLCAHIAMTLSPRQSSTLSPPSNSQDPDQQPSYVNISTEDPPLSYREVLFDKPPEQQPKPEQAPQKATTSYTLIDFTKTAEYNDETRSGGGALQPHTWRRRRRHRRHRDMMCSVPDPGNPPGPSTGYQNIITVVAPVHVEAGEVSGSTPPFYRNLTYTSSTSSTSTRSGRGGSTSYLQLDFKTSNHVTPTLATQQSIPNIPEEDPALVSTPSAGPVVDETKVTYGVLNFTQTKALSELSKEREQEIEREKEQREEKERERANTHNKKKKGVPLPSFLHHLL